MVGLGKKADSSYTCLTLMSGKPCLLMPLGTMIAKGHPHGLRILFIASVLFTISFAAILTGLCPYIVDQLQFDPSHAYQLYVSYIAIYYTAGLVGGILGSFFEQKRVVLIGGLLSIIGLVAISLNNLLYLALATFIIGSGMIHPNLLALTSSLYRKQDPRRYFAFYLIYTGMSLGVLIGLIAVSIIPLVTGFSNYFLFIAFMSLCGLFIFIYGDHVNLPSNVGKPELESQSHPGKIFLYLTLIILFITLAYYLLSRSLSYYWMIAIGLFGIFGTLFPVVLFTTRHHRKVRMKLLGYFFCSFCFWFIFGAFAVTTRAAAPIDLERFTWDRLHAPLYLGIALDASFALVIGCLFMWLYRKVKGKVLWRNLFLGLSITGVGVLLWGSALAHTKAIDGSIPIACILLAYLCLMSGEYLITPTILANITRFVPRRCENVFFGVHMALVGLAWSFIAYLFDQTHAMAHGIDSALSSHHLAKYFFGFAAILFALVNLLYFIKKRDLKTSGIATICLERL